MLGRRFEFECKEIKSRRDSVTSSVYQQETTAPKMTVCPSVTLMSAYKPARHYYPEDQLRIFAASVLIQMSEQVLQTLGIEFS